MQIQYKPRRIVGLADVYGFAIGRLGYGIGYDTLPAVATVATLVIPRGILWRR